MSALEWAFWGIVVAGVVGITFMLGTMWGQIKRVGIFDPAHASRHNHLSILGVDRVKPYRFDPKKSDAEALAADWLAVGNDLRVAMGQKPVKQEDVQG